MSLIYFLKMGASGIDEIVHWQTLMLISIKPSRPGVSREKKKKRKNYRIAWSPKRSSVRNEYWSNNWNPVNMLGWAAGSHWGFLIRVHYSHFICKNPVSLNCSSKMCYKFTEAPQMGELTCEIEQRGCNSCEWRFGMPAWTREQGSHQFAEGKVRYRQL